MDINEKLKVNIQQTVVVEATPTREYSAIDTGLEKKALPRQLSEQLLEEQTDKSEDEKSESFKTTSQTIISKACDQEIAEIEAQANPFVGQETEKRKSRKRTSREGDKDSDPLGPLKKGLLMSTYRQSPIQSVVATDVSGGADNSFSKAAGQYAGVRAKSKARRGNNSMIERGG